MTTARTAVILSTIDNSMKRLLFNLLILSVIALTIPTASAATDYTRMKPAKLEKLASKGVGEAQTVLALNYLKGANGYSDNPAEGARWMRLAADNQDNPLRAKACRYVGECYLRGTGVETDNLLGWHYMENALAAGNTDEETRFVASYYLAEMCLKGTIADANVDKAIELLEPTKPETITGTERQQYVADKHELLGNCYLKRSLGTLSADDTRRAISAFRQDIDARSNVAADPDSVRRDMGRLYFLMGKAQFVDALLHEPSDFKTAIASWEKGAAYGDEASAYNAGQWLMTGHESVTPDKEKASRLLTGVAAKHPRASYLLATYYYSDRIDYPRAIENYQYTLDNYDAATVPVDVKCDALRKLATMYRYGRGTAIDVAHADALVSEAASLGDPDAMKIYQWLTNNRIMP